MQNVYLALKRSVLFVLLLGCVAAFAAPVVNSFYPMADAAEKPVARIDTTNMPDSTAPAIINFWPKSGQQGTVVHILGSNFAGATAVHFGGVLADSIVILNDTTIQAIVDTGATGSVSVTTPYGTASKPGFTFIGDTTNIPDSTCPAIVNFWPTSGQKGTAVYILGSNFTSATAVRFGGVLADSIILMSDTMIKAIVDTGATGNVSVSTPYCFASKPGFTFIGDTTNIPDSTCPAIVNFWPTSGQKGTEVYILGSNFTSATAVRFGGVLADSIIIMSDTMIKAIVDTGATGSVSVATPYCFASKPGFTFIGDTTNIPDSTCPAIVNFWPTSGQKGTAVYILGSNFTSATAVRFGGVLADSIVIISDTIIKAIVDTGATGNVSVATPYCFASKPGFTFIGDTTNIPDSTCPVIVNFWPTSGQKGTAVYILGSNFTGATAVRFGGVLADSIILMSDTMIKAIVDTGATGNVSVSTPYCFASKPGFTFIGDTTNIPNSTCPAIVNFWPTSGQKGTAVYILGSNFTGATAVRFGGVLADSIVIMSDTIIKAIVDTGATGSVSVATPYCFASKPGFTYTGDTTINDTLFVSVRTNISNGTTPGSFVLYPNPASKYVIWQQPATSHRTQLQLVDMSGRMARQIVVPGNAVQTTIPLSGLQAGVYKLVWIDGKNRQTRTLLVR